MSFFSLLAECVKSGAISQQSAFLAQLIESGIRTKDQLAESINKTIRTVERQLKELYQAGIIRDSGDMLIVTTDLSVDKILKDYISINNNIDNTNDKTVDTIHTVAEMLGVSPKRIEQAVKNARCTNLDNAIIAAQKTLQRNPMSPVGYFVRILQNAEKIEPTEEKSTWESICEKIKPIISKASYSTFFIKTKCVKKEGKLYIQGTNAPIMWRLYSNLLQSLGIHGYLAGGILQEAI